MEIPVYLIPALYVACAASPALYAHLLRDRSIGAAVALLVAVDRRLGAAQVLTSGL